MTGGDELIRDSPEELFENAPCGYLTTALDGTILQVNRTLQTLTGHARDALVGRRFPELLTVGGRIYYETHYAPLLQMQGWVREIAVDLVGPTAPSCRRWSTRCCSATRTASRCRSATVVFEATDRRRYEQELLAARDREHAVAAELQRGLLSGGLPHDPALDLASATGPPWPAWTSAATGTTRSGSASGGSAWSSATSSAAGSSPPRRWGSCAARCARWPPPA